MRTGFGSSENNADKLAYLDMESRVASTFNLLLYWSKLLIDFVQIWTGASYIIAVYV